MPLRGNKKMWLPPGAAFPHNHLQWLVRTKSAVLEGGEQEGCEMGWRWLQPTRCGEFWHLGSWKRDVTKRCAGDEHLVTVVKNKDLLEKYFFSRGLKKISPKSHWAQRMTKDKTPSNTSEICQYPRLESPMEQVRKTHSHKHLSPTI